VKGQRKLKLPIIFESVLMLFTPKWCVFWVTV